MVLVFNTPIAMGNAGWSMSDITTIQITEETWRELNMRKNPGETFDDVIQRLLEDADGDD